MFGTSNCRKESEMWTLNLSLSTPKHNNGIYSFKCTSTKTKRSGPLKLKKPCKTSVIDSISSIACKVDLMSIENHQQSEDKCEGYAFSKFHVKDASKIDIRSVDNTHKHGNKYNGILLTEVRSYSYVEF